MSQIDTELISRYDENGYLVIRDGISKEKIDELSNFIVHVIKIEANRLGIVETDNEKLLNQIMIQIKKENPISASWIYETINNSNVFKKFIYNLQLESIVSKLIDTDNENNIGTVSPALRIDIPHDDKNIRDWHQDGSYFLDNMNGNNSLVVWISLGTSNKENGGVIICPKSHLEKKIKSDYKKQEKLKSEQHIAPQSIIEKYDQTHLVTKKGDVAFIQMDTIHKSGYNSSNVVRYTAQIRFTNIAKNDYNPPTQSAKYRNYLRPLQLTTDIIKK